MKPQKRKLPFAPLLQQLPQNNTGTFSPFAIGNPLTSLPVMIINFDAKAQGGSPKTLITWQTATEINSQYFAIQRSTDGLHWQNIGSVMAAGNSSSLLSYQFIDFNPAPVNFYRLNQVDINGQNAVTDIIKVDFHTAAEPILKVYPNPAKGSVNIETSETATYSVMDINGRIVTEGNVSGQVQLQNLVPGLYMIKVTMYDTIKNIKLIIQ